MSWGEFIRGAPLLQKPLTPLYVNYTGKGDVCVSALEQWQIMYTLIKSIIVIRVTWHFNLSHQCFKQAGLQLSSVQRRLYWSIHQKKLRDPGILCPEGNLHETKCNWNSRRCLWTINSCNSWIDRHLQERRRIFAMAMSRSAPQGTILVPLLYIIYGNDLPWNLHNTYTCPLTDKI